MMPFEGAMPKKARLPENLEQPTPEVLVQEAWGVSVAPALWEETAWSGKAYAKLYSAGGALYLRRYPKTISATWLSAVHEAVAYLESHGVRLFPHFLPSEIGDSLVHHRRNWYDLSDWAPGGPIRPEQLSDEQLTNLGDAIARLHQAGVGSPGPAVRFDWLSGRSAETLYLAWDPVARGNDAWQKPENLAAFFGPLVLDERVAAAPEVRDAISAAEETLRWLGPTAGIEALTAETPTLAHGDLWWDHAWFDGTVVGALLDLDTLAVRPPGGDVAALYADFGLWEPGRCAAILAGYRRHREVPSEVLAALPRLAALRTLGVLRSRLRSWLARPEAPLAGPIRYWIEQLRAIRQLPSDDGL